MARDVFCLVFVSPLIVARVVSDGCNHRNPESFVVYGCPCPSVRSLVVLLVVVVVVLLLCVPILLFVLSELERPA